MERTNQRVAYTLAGESGGYSYRLEVSRHDDGSQFTMSGSMSGYGSQWRVSYSVTGENVNVSVDGPEEGAALAISELPALAYEERTINTEEQ